MGQGHEGGEAGRHGDQSWLPEFRMILEIAGAMRSEFGVAIDAHPGGVGSEAGVVNRAFLTAVGVILGDVASPGDDPAAVLTWALRRTALLRLDELGVSEQQAEALLVMVPALDDRWLAYLALAPAKIVEDLLGPKERPRTAP